MTIKLSTGKKVDLDSASCLLDLTDTELNELMAILRLEVARLDEAA